MKKIIISNGETRIGYEFKDLNKEAQDTVLNWWIEGEIQDMDEDSPYYYLAAKMQRNQTPWFLGEAIMEAHKSDIIETIEINEYLFDEDGEILPVTITEIQKSNDLRHSITVKGLKTDLYINIRLNDECKNGHQDFAITGDEYKAGRAKTDSNFLSGGCIHDTILKKRPNLKKFVDLHLCDYSGAPMYAMGNGFYHLKDKPEVGKEHLRLTDAEFEAVKNVEDELQLSCILQEMGVPQRWKQEAEAAIKTLEELTGKEFVNDSKRSHYTPPTPEQIAEYKNKVATGYYTPEQVEQRKRDKAAAKQAKIMADLKAHMEKETKKAENEYLVKMAVLNTGLPLDNFIYYTHSNEGAFNWNTSSYNKAVTPEQFEQFLAVVDYNGLPDGITFKLGKR